MAGDYVPHSELKLVSWAEKFVAFLEEHADESGLNPGQLSALRLELDEYAAAYGAHQAAQTAARSACRTKDAARRPLVKHLRMAAARMQAGFLVPSETKAEAKAVIGKSPRHPKLDTSDDRPVAIIDGGRTLKHVIRVFNQNSTGIHKARPCDVTGCQVWRQIGDETDEWEMVDLMRGKPFVIEYSGEDIGRQVRYRFCWVTRAGEKGSWSDIKSATVAG